MTAPFTLEKTWLFSVNQLLPASSNATNTAVSILNLDCRAILYAIVSSMLAFGGGLLWTAKLSSDSATAGAGNRWLAVTNLVWVQTSGNHSWIVLHNALTGVELLFDLIYPAGGNYGKLTASVSVGGLFTGGTISAAPTATDSYVLINNNYWTNRGADSATIGMVSRVHIMCSSDGGSTRIFVYCAGVRKFTMLIETLADTAAAAVPWAVPVAIWWSYNVGVTWTYLSGVYWWTKPTALIAGGQNMSLATECTGGAPVHQLLSGLPNDISESYSGSACQIFCTTVGFRGRQGRFVDMWLGSPGVLDAETTPISATQYQFAQFDHLILPWDSTNPVLTS